MPRFATTMIFCLASANAWAQDRDGVARQLSNAIASLASVPFQFNYEEGAGVSGDGHRGRLNVQPVIPASIGEAWNLISRTIVPLVQQGRIVPGAGEHKRGASARRMNAVVLLRRVALGAAFEALGRQASRLLPWQWIEIRDTNSTIAQNSIDPEMQS